MEAVAPARRTTTIAERMVRCVFCRDPIPLQIAIRSRGVCQLCIAEIAELSWRTVYDRDRNFGAIPSNLKAAYNL